MDTHTHTRYEVVTTDLWTEKWICTSFSSQPSFHSSRYFLFVNGFIAAPCNLIFGGTKCLKMCCFAYHILALHPRLTLFASCESQTNHMNQGVNWCKTTWEGCEESTVFYQCLRSYSPSSDPV